MCGPDILFITLISEVQKCQAPYPDTSYLPRQDTSFQWLSLPGYLVPKVVLEPTQAPCTKPSPAAGKDSGIIINTFEISTKVKNNFLGNTRSLF